MKYLVIVGLVLAVGSFFFPRQSDAEKVYIACQQSRVFGVVSEDECGQLQDQYGLEYVCKERNSERFNPCWIEERSIETVRRED